MENSNKISSFESSFDVIQQNTLLTQYKFNTDSFLNQLAEKTRNFFISNSSVKTTTVKLICNKNSSVSYTCEYVSAISPTRTTVTMSAKYVSTQTFQIYDTSPITDVNSTLKNTLIRHLKKLLLLNYRKDFNFSALADNIIKYAKANRFSEQYVETYATPIGNLKSKTITVKISVADFSVSDYIKKDTANSLYILVDGTQISTSSKKYTFTLTDETNSYDVSETFNKGIGSLTVAEYRKVLDSLVSQFNMLEFKNIIQANTSEDIVFSTLFNFFKNSDTFESQTNFLSKLMIEFRNYQINSAYDYPSDNISLLNYTDSMRISDSAEITNDTSFNIFKFPTIKNKRFIESVSDPNYNVIDTNIIKMITATKFSIIRVVTDILNQSMPYLIADSSANPMETFLSRILGPSFTNVITYQQLYNVFLYMAKLLENIKLFSFNVYFKRSSVYPYKLTLFSSTLYPEIPFNNNETDSYYQAVLDSPIFYHTGVNCNSLADVDTTLSFNDNDHRSDYYSNFFEILYSSNEQYSSGKIKHPYFVSRNKLIYTTVESHNETPTFDIYSKTGSNGQSSFFTNYITSTYNLTNQLDSIFSLFDLKPSTIIKKKNVLQAFYFLMSKWHENLRTLHCNIFCCHMNCHTGQYFIKSSTIPGDISDSTIQKNIVINYHFYGWNDDGTRNTAIPDDPSIFIEGLHANLDLPENEVITTWSSSRTIASNEYNPAADQLTFDLKFPQYHGGGTGIDIYADYVINNFFSINSTNQRWYSESDSGCNYSVKIQSPKATLGEDYQTYNNTLTIKCEDRLDAESTITTLTGTTFIPQNWYLTTDHTNTTDLNFTTAPTNTMISCIPLSIDVYYKATLDSDTPPGYGKYDLEKDTIFELITTGSDSGWVIPDTRNFATALVYNGTNAASLPTANSTLGIDAANRGTVGYFATEFTPCLSLYTCVIKSGDTLHPDIRTNFEDLYRSIYPTTTLTNIHDMLLTECNISYSNKNGMATSVGTIRIAAKTDSKIFKGSTLINYTVNILQPLDLNSDPINIDFSSADIHNITDPKTGKIIKRYVTTLKPTVECSELVKDSDPPIYRPIQQSLLNIEYLPETTVGNDTQINIQIKPRSSGAGNLYFTGTKTLTGILEPPSDPDIKFGQGLKYLGNTIKFPGIYGKKDTVGNYLKWCSESINVDNVPKGKGLVIYAECYADRDQGHTHTCVGSISLIVDGSNIGMGMTGSGNAHYVAATACYVVRGNSGGSTNKHSYQWQQQLGTIIPASNIDTATSGSTVRVGIETSIFDPNYDRGRNIQVDIKYNYKELTPDSVPRDGGDSSVPMYTVTLSLNGVAGSVSPTSITVPADYNDSGDGFETYGTLNRSSGWPIPPAIPTDAATYTFNGWSTSSSGSIVTGSEHMSNGSTLYAIWTTSS